MGLFEKIASEVGVGQPEILDLFKKSLERVSRIPILTKDLREGVSLAFASLVDELQAQGVASDKTKESILEELKRWNEGTSGK